MDLGFHLHQHTFLEGREAQRGNLVIILVESSSGRVDFLLAIGVLETDHPDVPLRAHILQYAVVGRWSAEGRTAIGVHTFLRTC
jgi:ABC-type histidine transport system ATPase subunit